VFSKFLKGSSSTLGSTLKTTYYRNTTLSGNTAYSSDINLPGLCRIVIDDKNIARLGRKVERALPASLYSRAIANG